MSSEATTSTRWDALYQDERHHLVYPSEHVVRFLMQMPGTSVDAVDIGCGTGRHTRLMTELGFNVSACDSTHRSVTGTTGGGDHAPMTALPYPDAPTCRPAPPRRWRCWSTASPPSPRPVDRRGPRFAPAG